MKRLFSTLYGISYFIVVIGISIYIYSSWFSRNQGGLIAFAIIFCGVNVVGIFFSACYQQLERKNDILYGEMRKNFEDEKNRLNNEYEDKNKRLYKEIEDEKVKAHKEMLVEKRRLVNKQNEIEKRLEALAEKEVDVKKITGEKTKGFPWLANAFADYQVLQDEKLADYLETKSHPAYTAAEAVKKIKQEKRMLTSENKQLRYVIEYYEALFPWLVDLKDIDDEDIKMVLSVDNNETSDDMAKKWLTESEYRSLSTVEKYQRALERYAASKKNKWQIGRDFERYIGYIYEQKGYIVEYRGIIDGFEDLGRDLICKSNDKICVVQCKCWSQNKIIHEKHINQLLGTTIMYSLQMKASSKIDVNNLSNLFINKSIVPVFITSTNLSETANKFADALGVEVHQGISLGKYPLIKCNINPTSGDKIYHLPFDQQYDKTQINKKGEFYAWTVQEADDNGFRRAMRWHGNTASS